MEDAAYLQSTQYRYFTFTPQTLSRIRQNTNALASTRLDESMQSAIAAGDMTPLTNHPSPLTAEEELKLVSYYLTTSVALCDHFNTGSDIRATTLSYLQRLYLRISPLQIHPKTLLLPILFLAFKVERGIQSTSWFISTAALAGLTVTKEELLAPEIDIAMNLRWAFQMQHPFRGVEGVKMELHAMATGSYRGPGEGPHVRAAFAGKRIDFDRVERTCGGARALLTGNALFTDVYFLYTPAQITLAGLWVVDREVAEEFVNVKVPDEALRTRLKRVVRECAERHLMATPDAENMYPGLLLRLPQNGVPMGVEVTPELKKEV